MWKGLSLVAFLALAGCSHNFMAAAEEDCRASGFDEKNPQWFDCVRLGYDRRAARLDRIRAGLAGASSTLNNGTPSVAPQRHGRFLKSSYVTGMNRICLYDTISGTEAVTIGATDICPLN